MKKITILSTSQKKPDPIGAWSERGFSLIVKNSLKSRKEKKVEIVYPSLFLAVEWLKNI